MPDAGAQSPFGAKLVFTDRSRAASAGAVLLLLALFAVAPAYAGTVIGLVAAGLLLRVLLVEAENLYDRFDPSRRAAQLARLREIEECRLFFNSSVDLLLVTDTYGNFVRVSASAADILGYKPEEMVGRSAVVFIHPDDLEPTRDEMRSARRGRQIRNFDTRYLHKNGGYVCLSWTGVWAEAVHRHFFIGRDLTEQRRLEAAERTANEMVSAIVNAAPVAIASLARDRAVLVSNRAAEQMFGITADAAGRQNGVPLTQTPEFDRLFARAIAGETLHEVPLQYKSANAPPVDVTVSAAPMYDQGEVKAVAVALNDVTERNKLENQLRHSQKMDAIGQLTGGIAHDFNNMLCVITGTIDVLADSIADRPELAAIARLISEAADRGAELTGRLLAFARRQPLQPRATDINEVLVEAANLLRPTLGEQIDLDWHLSEDAWPAMVDRSQLVTAVLNLAVNARDAMPEGGQLTIETSNTLLDEDYCRVHAEVAPGPYLMIAVSDSGVGIPESIRDKIFEPFFTTKEVGRGTGLGLSMVYGFVKQTGGHIKVYSEQGHGTTFRIYLPRAESASHEAVAADAVEPEPSGGETILVVEDDPMVCTSVTAQLAHLGYRTITAMSAQEALAITDRGVVYDLLFTDMVMPGAMNGRRLAEEVLRRRKTMKVLFTSGYTADAAVHHGRLDRGVLLLPKPYRSVDLARMIRRALRGGEKSDEKPMERIA